MSTVLNPATLNDPVRYLFARWRDDPGGTYQSWFLWEEYLAMRRGILALNEKYRDLLSNDLGAVAGALFDIGTGRYPPPPGEAALAQWEADLARVREEADLANKAMRAAREEDRTHTEIQGWLRDLGRALGFAVGRRALQTSCRT